MTPLVLVENEATVGGRYDHWQDVTGERYQFPNQYRGKVLPGRPFVYYRGVRRADGTRGPAEYFGCGLVGEVYPDPANRPTESKARWKWICDIEDYRPFPVLVPASRAGSYLERIPRNFWGVAVRHLPEDVYRTILDLAAVGPAASTPSPTDLHLPPLDMVRPTVATTLLVTRTRTGSRDASVAQAGIRRSRYSAALGRRGEEVVLAHLRACLSSNEADTLRWVSDAGEQPGWDIEYRTTTGLMAVEVKATGGPVLPSVELTANEWTAAQAQGDHYHLWLVANVRSTSPRIQVIPNPAALVASGQITIQPLSWRLSNGDIDMS